MFKLLGQMWILVPCAIYVIAYGICNREFPGLDPINATVYLLGGILLIPSYIQAPRMYALSEIRRYGASEMPVFSKKFTYKRDGSNFTWAGIDEKSYRIAFSASEQGTVLNIFLDNAVSSLFAGMGAGTGITVLRGIVFYTPCVLALACPVLSFIFVIVRDNILYECAVNLAKEIEADLIANAGSPMKCYRNVCPKCGVVSTASLKHCNNCGTSLEVLDSTMGLGTLEFYRDDD